MGSLIADRIASLMDERSEAAFARKCGISQPLLRKYLTGSQPRIDKLLSISEATGVTLMWLATGQEPKFRSAAEGASVCDNDHLAKSCRQPDPASFPSTRIVTAENVSFYRHTDLVTAAWRIKKARGWLTVEFEAFERALFSRFPELKKKSANPRSSDGAA